MRYYLLLLIITPNLLYAWVSVGVSPGFGTCDFGFIQDAINSGATEIRVVGQEFTENLVINKSVDIKGSYTSCLTTHLDITNATNTTIRGDGVLGTPVLKINDSIQSNYSVNLYNLTLRDATDTSFVDGGHGIEIGDTSVFLTINDSLIINNTAENGGGIYIGNPVATDVIIKNSSIFGNTASNRGGGIFCANANTVIRVIDESLIGENTALNGGGIYAINGCKLIVDSGVDVNTSADLRGIMGNFATNNGGGIYADLAAEVYLYGNTYNGNPLLFPFISAGNSTQPFTLANNSASANGGGLYADRNSVVKIYDGLINNNTSSSLGGGIYLNNNSELTITTSSSTGGCWNSENKCSVLSNNKSNTNGGGIYTTNGSQASIEKSYILGNRSNLGTVLYARATSTSVTLLNNFIYKNGDNGANGYNDDYVVRGYFGADINMHHNTLANNDIANDKSILGITGTDTTLTITNSIINNNETILQQASEASYAASCILVDETSSMTGSGVANLNVNFIDPLNDGYRLSYDSDAIDYCLELASIPELDEDIDKQARPFDYPGIPNTAFGLADAGADEFHIFNSPDVIFIDGFE